jgi:hypothetical protein
MYTGCWRKVEILAVFHADEAYAGRSVYVYSLKSSPIVALFPEVEVYASG